MARESGARRRHGDAGNEVELIDRVAQADVRAFESLYRLYHARLSRFISGMLRQPAMVDEVVDDTMLVVWHKAHTYDASCRLSTWIFAIAYRQGLKTQRRREHMLVLNDEEPADPLQTSPDRELQQRQLRTSMYDAMDLLSAEHRAVIELTYYYGHSCREIADITGCPVATVKTRMFYARHKLKTLLTERGVQAL